MSVLYFTYGSLKQGFPNHDSHAAVLNDFVGTAVTSEAMPLIVPNEPHCTNPNCKFLHRQPTLVDMAGAGKRVEGEVYRLSEDQLPDLDELEGYKGPGSPDNVYERKTIQVEMKGKAQDVYVYVIADAEPKIAEWNSGTADVYAEYTLDMSTQDLKPEYKT